MSEIRFYMPEDETIPTDLRLCVDNVYVEYERIEDGFVFHVFIDDKEKAFEIVSEIVQQMEREHDESQHDVSWRTVSLEVVPQKERYRYGTVIEWKYRGCFLNHYKAMHEIPSAQPEFIRINLNEPIKVKLTDWGKEIYYHQFDRINRIAGREICKPKFPKEDENGYTKFQLWDFIKLYGMHIDITLPNVIEPLEIVYKRRTDE